MEFKAQMKAVQKKTKETRLGDPISHIEGYARTSSINDSLSIPCSSSQYPGDAAALELGLGHFDVVVKVNEFEVDQFEVDFIAGDDWIEPKVKQYFSQFGFAVVNKLNTLPKRILFTFQSTISLFSALLSIHSDCILIGSLDNDILILLHNR